jgi:hypothetical protein
MDGIPSITSKRILSYVGQRNFNLGQEYFNDGAIERTLREGNTIKATCQGTRPQPYRVWVIFNRRGIAESDCSCPVGSGNCKHVAALLIAWLKTPDAFTQTLPIEEKLSKLDKPQLLALLKRLLRHDPDLEQIIDAMPIPGQPITPNMFQKQADAIFATATGEWDEAGDLADQVMELAGEAKAFLCAGESTSAAAVYQGILASLIGHYEDFGYHDNDGELSSAISECVVGLHACLTLIKDQQQRLPFFRSLLDVLDLDENLGGVGIGDDAYSAIMEDATAHERREIARWINADPGYKDFVIDLLAQDVPDDEYLSYCRQHGRRHDLIERLLKRNRLEEAARELASAPENELPGIAEVFVAHRQADLAEQRLRERANRSKSPFILRWLKDRCIARRDHAGALEFARREFQLNMSHESYRQFRGIATKLRQWDTIRPELLAMLRKSADPSAFVSICLDEGMIDDALAVLQNRQRPCNFDQRLAIAKAAESSRPESAIEIYLGEAAHYISQRHRDAYQQACQYLKLARKLYEKSGQQSAWKQQLTTLRLRHKTLKAFLEELQKLE